MGKLGTKRFSKLSWFTEVGFKPGQPGFDVMLVTTAPSGAGTCLTLFQALGYRHLPCGPGENDANSNDPHQELSLLF